MKNKTNVLILTAPFGGGHKMAAESLKKEFLKKDANVEIFDLFSTSYPGFIDGFNKVYSKLFNIGNIYSFFYYGIDKLKDKQIMKLYKKFGYNKFTVIYEEFKPDIIINTFPILSVPEFKKKNSIDIPVINVVTDYCCHSLWLDNNVDKLYVATDDLKNKIKDLNYPLDKLVVSGIPVREEFYKELNKKNILEKYSLNKDKKIILISAGAFGLMKNLKELCISLNQFDNLQVVAVCGNNNELKKELDKLSLNNLKTFGYIDSIHELYKISSLMITKPGGITLSEAAAVKLPLILYKPVSGQEMENARFFERKGAAFIANSPSDILSYTIHLTNNSIRIRHMKKSLETIYQNNSSEVIVKDIIKSYVQ